MPIFKQETTDVFVCVPADLGKVLDTPFRVLLKCSKNITSSNCFHNNLQGITRSVVWYPWRQFLGINAHVSSYVTSPTQLRQKLKFFHRWRPPVYMLYVTSLWTEFGIRCKTSILRTDVFTARIRRMGEGNVFSLFTSRGGHSTDSARGGGSVSRLSRGRAWVSQPTQPGGVSQLGGGSVSCRGQLGGGPAGGWGSAGGVSQDRTTEGVLTTQRAVCLLRWRRRTFLFSMWTKSTPRPRISSRNLAYVDVFVLFLIFYPVQPM